MAEVEYKQRLLDSINSTKRWIRQYENSGRESWTETIEEWKSELIDLEHEVRSLEPELTNPERAKLVSALRKMKNLNKFYRNVWS
jgi:transposase-like protein